MPWLVLNLFTETVAVSAIAIFQNEVPSVVALAVLMPIISSLGGNAGTQTLAVAVRALAARELNASNTARIILRELIAGLANGLGLALVMGAAVMALLPRLEAGPDCGPRPRSPTSSWPRSAASWRR